MVTWEPPRRFVTRSSDGTNQLDYRFDGAMAGVFVIEARDLDHAIAPARLTPIVDGGVEVRPLLGFQILEAG